MKRFVIFLSVSAVLLLGVQFIGSSSTNNQATDTIATEDTLPDNTYQKLSPEEAKTIIDSDEPHILLDVRSTEEFTEEHLSGALLIPDHELEARAPADLPDKDTLILVYCHSGARSAASAQALADLGYTNVYDLGGIIDWPYETVKTPSTP